MLVRAAQGQGDEAERRLVDVLEVLRGAGFTNLELMILSRLERFMRERGRDREAAAYAERLARISPAAALGSAFASRMERIA